MTFPTLLALTARDTAHTSARTLDAILTERVRAWVDRAPPVPVTGSRVSRVMPPIQSTELR